MTGPTVEMYRFNSDSKMRDRFSCSYAAWGALWELGRAFGWQPMGATYVMPFNPKLDPARREAPARRNYEPGSVLDHKRIDADDAFAWADALREAKGSPHAAAMIEAQYRSADDEGSAGHEAFAGVLDEFVEFARGGGFEFADCGEHASAT